MKKIRHSLRSNYFCKDESCAHDSCDCFWQKSGGYAPKLIVKSKDLKSVTVKCSGYRKRSSNESK
jgi:hypothetical protein